MLAREPRPTSPRQQTAEVLSTTDPIDLFQDVNITEFEDGVRFDVPKRILQSGKYGDFELNVYGRLGYFKEHDDYGKIRFLQRDRMMSAAVWLPHLFAFEEVDPETNLPTILDRERCSFAINLSRVNEGASRTPRPKEIIVRSQQGIFAAAPSDDFTPGVDIWTEFQWYQHDAIGDHVEWPDEERPSLTNFLTNLMMTDVVRYMRLRSGEEELPDEFEQAKTPLDFRTRKPWSNNDSLQATGDIWVPIDALRRGISAQVEFLMLQR